MREIRQNLWTIAADVHVITTNGSVRRDGAAVMGRGCAWEATQRYPGLAQALGQQLTAHGNHVHGFPQYMLVTFPVKHAWWQTADPGLILQSTEELVQLTDAQGWRTVAMPRPGCGNGRLAWAEVKRIIGPLLDDRFVVCSRRRHEMGSGHR